MHNTIRQDQNIGTVIVGKGKYTEKYRNILNSKLNYFLNYEKTLQKL